MTNPRDDVPKEIRHLLAMPKETRTAESQQKIEEYLLSRDVMGKVLLDEIADLKKTIPIRPLLDIRVISQRTSSPRTTHILRRGDFLQPQAEVEPGVLAALGTDLPEEPEGDATRLELAHWLMNPENPLTARVAVNHIWKHLFGAGLVSTVSDFGLRGEKPTHPQLLDWLADEYMKLGWSRKKLIKTIVMSSAYRRDSRHRDGTRGDRSDKPTAGPSESLPRGGGNCPRRYFGRQRITLTKNRWPERLPADAGRRGRLKLCQQFSLGNERRRRSVPPWHVHLLQANVSLPEPGDVRLPRREYFLR